MDFISGKYCGFCIDSREIEAEEMIENKGEQYERND